MDFVCGLSAAWCAAILFGVQYVPCKRYNTYDGATFQWFMCCGILFGGIVLQLFGMTVLDWKEDPQIILPGVFGGMIWGTANFFVIPLVKVAGLALGFSLYHVVNLLTGYATTRFGLLGLQASPGTHPLLRDTAVAILVLSFALLFFVEPNETTEKNDDDEKVQNKNGHFDHCLLIPSPLNNQCGTTSTSSQQFNKKNELLPWSPRTREASTAGLTTNSSETDWADVLEKALEKRDSSATSDAESKDGPLRRKLLGVVLALASGVLTGLNALPFEQWTHTEEGQRMQPMQYVFSQTLGVFLSSTVMYLMYGGVTRFAGKRVRHSVIRPAFTAGLIWVMGNTCQLLGIDAIGYALGYCLAAVGPIMVASLLSVFVFKELTGRVQLTLFACAFLLQAAGCVMMAVGT